MRRYEVVAYAPNGWLLHRHWFRTRRNALRHAAGLDSFMYDTTVRRWKHGTSDVVWHSPVRQLTTNPQKGTMS